MKISELKQPYKRMAEYLAEKNTDERFYNKELLILSFDWRKTNHKFWNEVHSRNYSEITEEIKKHFPTDFDFSGEEKNPLTETSFTDLEPIAENLHKQIYTKLAKEGKFDELPDTCEFSEPVEVEVWDDDFLEPTITTILGKFKGKYVSKNFLCWKNAQLLPPKIDFSEFKQGDVVEIEKNDGVYFYGEIRLINEDLIKITMSKVSEMTTILELQNIKSIKKLK